MLGCERRAAVRPSPLKRGAHSGSPKTPPQKFSGPGGAQNPGKPRTLFRDNPRREVQGEARARLERADPAFAKNHVVPAGARYVLRGQEPLLDRRRETPFEDHAVVRPRDRGANVFQKGEVRHVAGPDLEYLGVLHDELY